MNREEIVRTYDFSGHVVVITGALGVLGSEMACALAGCGANVVLLDRNLEPGPRVQEAMGADGSARSMVVCADVLNREDLERASGAVLDRFGHVDALVNAAGGNKPDATTGARTFFDLSPDALRWVFDLNLLGTILPSQVFGKAMAKAGAGVILNVSSMNAFRPLTRVPAYSAAKAGVSNFTAWLAVHMAQEYSPAIRVNAIAPGFFLTTQNEYLLIDKESGDLTARGRAITAHTPMNRFGRPSDLVGAVLWLLSPASAFVTGIVVPIDGGFSAFSGV